MLDPTAVQISVEGFAGFVMRYFVALAAVGALTMAALEAWKKVFDTRTRFQMKAVARWMAEGAHEFQVAAQLGRVAPPEPRLAYAQLVHLTTGTEIPAVDDVAMDLLPRHGEIASRRIKMPRDAELALFSLDLDRMMGHIQDAADVALRDPERYPDLYRFLAWGAGDADIAAWQREAYAAAAMLDAERSNERAGLYARLHGAMRRRLDGFQLYTDYRWTNFNQLAANSVGALIMLCALVVANQAAGQGIDGAEWIFFIAVSLVGGALAPIAKDIVMALQRVRGA
jgi:hypothetical protein